MGIFNAILNRRIGNKKQKEAAEMLVGMVNNKEDGKDKPEYIESIKMTNGASNGFYILTLSNEAGDKQYSQVKIYGATDKYAGIMTSADKKKLDAVPESFPQIVTMKFTSTVIEESGAFSAITYFEDCGLQRGTYDKFENIYIVPVYSYTGEENSYDILPVQLIPLKELLLMGEFIYTFINPNTLDSVQYRRMKITAQKMPNPTPGEDEFLYAGLQLDITNVTFDPK
jgi:hypothetical protein